jgi:hypothetical protein
VPLEQLGERAVISGSEPFEQADGFARRVAHDLVHTL